MNTIVSIHERMPAMLLPEHEQEWLSNDTAPSQLQQLLYHYPDDLIKAYTVSSLVNSAANDVPEMLEPATYDMPKQGDLFG